MSRCFLQTVHEDVRGGVPVPQGGLRGRQQAGAEQRLLRRQQTAPRNGELRAAALRVRLDHRGVVGGESQPPQRDRAARHRATLPAFHHRPR